MNVALHSAHILRRHWKVTIIATFSLSIAIALCILGLSVSNTLLLLPPAAPAADRLVTIYNRSASKSIEEVSYPDYEYYRQNNHVFTDIAAAPDSIGLRADFKFEGHDVRVLTRPVSDNYFGVMGIKPYLGRLFAPGEDGSDARAAVMTYSCWRRLGSDPNIVGKTLAKNIIIGVAAKEFAGSFYGLNGDLFTTLAEADNNRLWMTQRGVRRLFLVARLRPEVSRRQAQAEMNALSGQLASAYPKDNKDRITVLTRATLLSPSTISTAAWMSGILIAFVLLVLVIACANAASLQLSVAVGRRQEAVIKLALGASRARLIREFLIESTILCTASGVLGYVIAAYIIAGYSDFNVVFPMYGSIPFSLHLRLDSTVITSTLVLIVIASVATGLAPALYASSPGFSQMLMDEVVVGGTRKERRRNAIAIIQIAVCTLVVIGMGLCERNLYNLRHADPGFSARNLVAVTIYLEGEGYSEARGKEFSKILHQTTANLPGVDSVSLAWDLPVLGASQTTVNSPNLTKPVSVQYTVVDEDYFATLGINLIAGRVFNSTDREGSPNVVVINRKLADMLWPGKDPVGRMILAGDPARKFIVVGVVPDGKYLDLSEPARPFMYYALSQRYRGAISVIARTRGDPGLWVEPFAQALRGLGLKIMIQPITFEHWINLTLLTERVVAGCVAILSVLGVGLAFIGLFGVLSYSVSERKKELGVRAALGATPWRLLRMILRQTARIAGMGIGIGLVFGIVATGLLRSQFYGISVIEWIILLPASGAMLALALVIAYLSARQWVTIDPMEAVRHA